MTWQNYPDDEREPWQQTSVAEPVFEPCADAQAKIDTLRALGVLKRDEEPAVTHAWQCWNVWQYSQRCTCPGGPEILWPDHDELKPNRARGQIIERFVITH